MAQPGEPAANPHDVPREDIYRAPDQHTTSMRSVQIPVLDADDHASGAAKLVDKLYTAGQLRAGFLLRVLSQGKPDLFEVAFAKLLQIELTPLRRLIYREGPDTLALACRAVGIDRCVFPTVFKLTRRAHGERETPDADARVTIEQAFTGFTKSEALARLRTMAAN